MSAIAQSRVIHRVRPAVEPVAVPLVGRIATWARQRPTDTAYTFVDFGTDPDGVRHELTWGDAHRRATALARRIRRVAAPGDRVAVLAPPGLEQVVALFAAWYAGAIAVPLFPPDLARHAERLAASYADCAPRCVITTAAARERVADFVRTAGGEPTLLLADDLDDGGGGDGGPPRSAAFPDDIAYLQYTSGSTRNPAGVEISYGNLAANVRQVWSALAGNRTRFTSVNWLPLFHDMGLVATVAVPLLHGSRSVFFDPAAFLMRPERWLRLLGAEEAAYTAAPNFAYDYCVRRIDPAARAGFDLSRVFMFLNGAEPVRADTVAAFAEAFAGTGLNPSVLCAAYGLAEATVFVAADRSDRPPTVTLFDRVALASGLAREAGEAGDPQEASALVSCGRAAGQRIAIVDPDRRVPLPDGRVGEIWVFGPNTAHRYWRQPKRSAEVFGATLAGSGGLPVGPWLRTGDLGVLHDGQLYVTGRRKDLVIVAGRNHYPQDIEETVAVASPVLADGRVVAFSVPVGGAEGAVGGAEGAVVVAERCRSTPPGGWQPDEVARDVRGAVWAAHDLALHDVVLTEPGGLPRTSSGKLSRSVARERYLAGSFPAWPAR
ncbi:fatty acyl-AMP ligase [Phytohabitans rumicis]|uniref:fatty acyl-AMP ligase n=1 Tax=Phytohabitans rumicis TaxID=1076125 RepID=UPI0031F1586D